MDQQGVDRQFLDDVSLGFKINGGGQRNEIDSINETYRPVNKSPQEFIAGSNTPASISNHMSVLMTEAFYKGDIPTGFQKDKNSSNVNMSYMTSLMMGKLMVSYSKDGASADNIKDTLGGFLGGVGRRLKSFGRNNDPKPYESNGFE